MYHTNKTLNVKQGDNNLMTCNLVDDDGLQYDLSNTQITAQIRDTCQRLCGEMNIKIANAPKGAFFMSVPSHLARGIYYSDVQFAENGVIRHSDIFKIIVKETITYAHAHHC